VTVADLQLHLRHLSEFLAAAGSKKMADELKDLGEKLEPFKDSRLKAFGEFLTRAHTSGGSGPGPQKKGGSRKTAALSTDEVQRLFERVRNQYHNAPDPSVTMEEIEATAQELEQLSEVQLADLAKQVEIDAQFHSRADAIKAIRQKLLERKAATERFYA
jgi:hypothetical protein